MAHNTVVSCPPLPRSSQPCRNGISFSSGETRQRGRGETRQRGRGNATLEGGGNGQNGGNERVNTLVHQRGKQVTKRVQERTARKEERECAPLRSALVMQLPCHRVAHPQCSRRPTGSGGNAACASRAPRHSIASCGFSSCGRSGCPFWEGREAGWDAGVPVINLLLFKSGLIAGISRAMRSVGD